MNKNFFLALMVMFFLGFQSYAQGDEEDGPAPPPPAPIDMMTPFLLASAILYGYRLKNK